MTPAGESLRYLDERARFCADVHAGHPYAATVARFLSACLRAMDAATVVEAMRARDDRYALLALLRVKGVTP